MEYLKPQSPVKIGENYIYPLTTSDQIINGDGERIKNIADTNEICYLYSAIFSLGSWIGEGPYTQAATLTAVDGGGQVTAQSTLLACVGIDGTLPQETKDAMQRAASDIVNAEKTLGNNTISVSLTNKPDVEVELYFLIKEGNGSNIPTLNPVIQDTLTIYDPSKIVTSSFFEPQNFGGEIFKVGNVVTVNARVKRESAGDALPFPAFTDEIFKIPTSIASKHSIAIAAVARNTGSGAKYGALVSTSSNGVFSGEFGGDGQWNEVFFNVSYII